MHALTLLTTVLVQRNGHETDEANNESVDIDDDQEAMDVEIVFQNSMYDRKRHAQVLFETGTSNGARWHYSSHLLVSSHLSRFHCPFSSGQSRGSMTCIPCPSIFQPFNPSSNILLILASAHLERLASGRSSRWERFRLPTLIVRLVPHFHPVILRRFREITRREGLGRECSRSQPRSRPSGGRRHNGIGIDQVYTAVHRSEYP